MVSAFFFALKPQKLKLIHLKKLINNIKKGLPWGKVDASLVDQWSNEVYKNLEHDSITKMEIGSKDWFKKKVVEGSNLIIPYCWNENRNRREIGGWKNTLAFENIVIV